MAIYFTADTHFGHGNIINYCGRPFPTLAEHNETMIANWNHRVRPEDYVYHLGDFGWGSPDYLAKVAGRLTGKICFIKGNHDKASVIKEGGLLARRFVFVKDVHFLTVQHKGKKYEIFLSHYAHRTWPKSNHGSIHLFGHSHGNMPSHGRSFDVGVDCWNFTPVSMDQIINKVSTLTVALDYTNRGKGKDNDLHLDIDSE